MFDDSHRHIESSVNESPGLWYRGGIVLAFLLLLPILTFPAGPDQAIYAVGGKMLLRGMTYYVQIGDLKPPFIHLIYGVAQGLFGDGMFGPRLVELLAQWGTLFFLLKLTRRFAQDRRVDLFAAIIYAILYIALGPDATGQPESYVGLILFPTILLMLGKQTSWRLLAVGGLTGLLFLVKYSMVVVPLLFVLVPFLLGIGSRREEWRTALLIAAGAVVPVLCYFLWMKSSGALPGFFQINEFIALRQRSAMKGGGMLERFQGLGLWLGFSFGATATTLLSLGVWRTVRMETNQERGGKVDRHDHLFFKLLALIVLALFVSALAELMMLPYQFSRLYAPAAIIIASVLCSGIFSGRTLRLRSIRGAYSIILALTLAGFALLFSPVPRYLLETARGASWRLSGAAATNRWFRPDSQLLQELQDVGDTIRARSANVGTDSFTSSENLVALSGYAGYLYCYTGILPIYSQLHGHQAIASFAPNAWREELRTILTERPPKFVVIERNDEGAVKVVEAESTDRAVAEMPGVAELLREKYDTAMTRNSFVLYQARAERTEGE